MVFLLLLFFLADVVVVDVAAAGVVVVVYQILGYWLSGIPQCKVIMYLYKPLIRDDLCIYVFAFTRKLQ